MEGFCLPVVRDAERILEAESGEVATEHVLKPEITWV